MSQKQCPLSIGFLGAGRMATALAQGLVSSEFLAADQILAADVSPEARSRFAEQVGAAVTEENSSVAEQSDILFLAVKPQCVSAALESVSGKLSDEKLLISIAAGVPLSRLVDLSRQQGRWVRVMPNTPALVGAGASAFCASRNVTEDDRALVKAILSTVGLAVELPEPLMDAVTGLSGSGPAYVYQFIEALSDAGVEQGIPRDVATQLAAQTVLGGAMMVLKTGQHPAVLKDAVTSPGGTTITGLHVLEQSGLRAGLMSAVEAATVRSQQLGQNEE